MTTEKSLPFEVAPEVETRLVGRGKETGQLRLPVIHGLRLAERLSIREVDRTAEVFQRTAKLAVEIAATTNQDATELYKSIGRVMAGAMGVNLTAAPEDMEILVGHSDAIAELAQFSADVHSRLALRAATVMIRSRVNGCSDWTEDDTKTLHDDLIDDLYGFYISEAQRLDGPLDPEKEIAELERALGKSQPARGRRRKNPTGPKSSGFASTGSPASQDSPESASHSNPSE